MRTIAPLVFLARFAFALFLSVPGIAPALAQSSTPGSIEGRVYDSSRGGYLESARVTVEGTSLETLTDEGGYYVLGNVPSGLAKVRVFFTGLAPVSAAVQVPSGRAATQDFTLGS